MNGFFEKKKNLFSVFQWNARSSMIRTFSFAFNQCDYYAWTGNGCHNKTINVSNEFLISFAFEVTTSSLWTHQKNFFWWILMLFRNCLPMVQPDLIQLNSTWLDSTRPDPNQVIHGKVKWSSSQTDDDWSER